MFFCKKNIDHMSGENVLPFVNSVLLMPSPLIKINTNCADEMNDLQKVLQLTPGETNSSMMSLPSTAQANSSAIASTAREMSNVSDLNLDAMARDYLNLSEESLTIPHISASAQFTPIKSNRNVSQEQTRDKLDYEFKVNKPKLDDFTEVQFVSNENMGTVVKHENSSRRRSISDLVERYKKVLEVSSSTMTKFQNEFEEQKV